MDTTSKNKPKEHNPRAIIKIQEPQNPFLAKMYQFRISTKELVIPTKNL
jgi:hypothetical protein